MTATLTITPHSPAEKRLEMVCSHGSSLAYFAPGSLKLTDVDLGRILAGGHRAAYGCRCSDQVALVYPAAEMAERTDGLGS